MTNALPVTGASAGPSGTEVALEVDGLATYYPAPRSFVETIARQQKQFVRAVDGVSFSIAVGEMLALVGESGSGKTTVAQSVLRMVESRSGSMRLEGTEISKLSQRQMRRLRSRIQLVYQDPYESLDPRFRVRQTVEEPLLVHNVAASRKERASLIEEALERSGLAPAQAYLDRYPHELSGGQRQRVAIAAALTLNPVLLVADEPVSMLDVSVRAEVLDLLDRLRREQQLAILMITHDLSTAARYADRIAVMYLGRIVEQGLAADVIRNPQHPYTQALLSVVPQRDPRMHSTAQILKGETPNPLEIPSGCRFHPRCPLAQEQCKSTDPQLAHPSHARNDNHLAACLLT